MTFRMIRWNSSCVWHKFAIASIRIYNLSCNVGHNVLESVHKIVAEKHYDSLIMKINSHLFLQIFLFVTNLGRSNGSNEPITEVKKRHFTIFLSILRLNFCSMVNPRYSYIQFVKWSYLWSYTNSGYFPTLILFFFEVMRTRDYNKNTSLLNPPIIFWVI